MNNRKQSNKRGKNPRSFRTQLIQEPSLVTRLKGGVLKQVPNPRAGTVTRIVHTDRGL